MTGIGTFPTIREPLKAAGLILNCIASGALKAGMVVCYAATGVTDTVIAHVATADLIPVGVVIADAASGAKVAVASVGSIVTVANADDTTTIDAGGPVGPNNNAVGGTVNEVTSPGGSTTTSNWIVGFALDDIAASGTGRIVVAPSRLN
jgi:hypothetical protein